MEPEPDQEITLFKTLDRLGEKLKLLEEVENLSYEIVKKFYNPINNPLKESETGYEDKEPLPSTIVDLFFNLEERIDEKIISLKTNLNKINKLIG